MVTIVADSPLVALGTALEIGMFRSVFPDAPPETPYLLCFQSVLIDFSGLSRIYLPPDDVTFVFEQNSDYEYNAAFLFDKLKKTTKWADHNRLDVVTYASKGKRIGLQPADLVAREVMKHRHNELSSKRLTRASIRGLANQHKCEFRFFTRADLELIRSRAIADWLQKTLAEYAAELGMEIANARTRGSVS
jgi:hypothetical protein